MPLITASTSRIGSKISYNYTPPITTPRKTQSHWPSLSQTSQPLFEEIFWHSKILGFRFFFFFFFISLRTISEGMKLCAQNASCFSLHNSIIWSKFSRAFSEEINGISLSDDGNGCLARQIPLRILASFHHIVVALYVSPSKSLIVLDAISFYLYNHIERCIWSMSVYDIWICNLTLFSSISREFNANNA